MGQLANCGAWCSQQIFQTEIINETNLQKSGERNRDLTRSEVSNSNATMQSNFQNMHNLTNSIDQTRGIDLAKATREESEQEESVY